MKKSEAFAHYHLFETHDMTEISQEEFNDALLQALCTDKESVLTNVYDGDTTSRVKITTDGMTYYGFSSCYKVGWQGDVDCDTFYCKVKTLTRDDMKEIASLFGAQY